MSCSPPPNPVYDEMSLSPKFHGHLSEGREVGGGDTATLCWARNTVVGLSIVVHVLQGITHGSAMMCNAFFCTVTPNYLVGFLHAMCSALRRNINA